MDFRIFLRFKETLRFDLFIFGEQFIVFFGILFPFATGRFGIGIDDRIEPAAKGILCVFDIGLVLVVDLLDRVLPGRVFG